MNEELQEQLNRIEKKLDLILKSMNIKYEDKEDNDIILLDILENKDPIKCYQYVLKHKDMDFSKLEEIIIDSKDLEANYNFMKNIDNCDFNKHLQVILDSKDPEYNYYVAVNFNLDLDTISKIRKIIVDSKNLEYNYRFADDIKNIYHVDDIDISDLERVILEGMDLQYYYLFCKNVNNANIKLFQDILLEVSSIGDIEMLINFGVDINKKELEIFKDKIKDIYNNSDSYAQKEIVNTVDKCEKKKIYCIFRRSFGDPVVIE